MKKPRLFGHVLILALLIVLSRAVSASASTVYPGPDRITAARSSRGIPATDVGAPESEQPAEVPTIGRAQSSAAGEVIIIDHTSTDITAIPQEWIEEAKRTLHIGYGRTSHGSQVTGGMIALVNFANNGGLGLSLPQDIFSLNYGGTDGALDLREGDMYPDAGTYPRWVNETRAYLGSPDPVTGRGTNNPEINVIMWAWCGGASTHTEQTMLDTYLLPMTQLEADYPGVTFIYMTGHADGTGEEGNLHLRNQQIRNYCIENDKVLYDFYDIELYDPDGNYYGDKAVNDNCDYDSDGDGSLDGNWALEWQNSHPSGVYWYYCGCPHSQDLNCNQKGYAAWWLWARLAGWASPSYSDLSPSYKSVSSPYADHGERVTYTIGIRNSTGPLPQAVLLTDTIPTGVIYAPGTLTATTGSIVDTAAPTLTWSGILTPTPAVTITYAVTVSATTPHTIINSAIIATQGYDIITRTATVRTNWRTVYLPLVMRH